MNPQAILNLLSDLYEQIASLRINEKRLLDAIQERDARIESLEHPISEPKQQA